MTKSSSEWITTMGKGSLEILENKSNDGIVFPFRCSVRTFHYWENQV